MCIMSMIGWLQKWLAAVQVLGKVLCMLCTMHHLVIDASLELRQDVLESE